MVRLLVLIGGAAVLVIGILLYASGSNLISEASACLRALACAPGGEVNQAVSDIPVPQQLASGEVDESVGIFAVVLGFVLLAYGATSERREPLEATHSPDQIW